MDFPLDGLHQVCFLVAAKRVFAYTELSRRGAKADSSARKQPIDDCPGRATTNRAVRRHLILSGLRHRAPGAWRGSVAVVAHQTRQNFCQYSLSTVPITSQYKVLRKIPGMEYPGGKPRTDPPSYKEAAWAPRSTRGSLQVVSVVPMQFIRRSPTTGTWARTPNQSLAGFTAKSEYGTPGKMRLLIQRRLSRLGPQWFPVLPRVGFVS